MVSRLADQEAMRGQIIIIFPFLLIGLLFLTGLVIDGGYGFGQRRAAQNAADLGALAGARAISVGGTDADVRAAIQSTVQSNRGAVTFGSTGPWYVDKNGAQIVAVGTTSVPSNAAGVRVPTSLTWSPFMARLVGMNTWSTTAVATARGVSNQAPPRAGIFPVGISAATFDQSWRAICVLCPAQTPSANCQALAFTDGGNNRPGAKSWLKFGCAGYGLGQGSNGGCDNDAGFLQDEIGHDNGQATPAGQSFGCCTAVGLSGSQDLIGSVPGNKASADCDWYITNHVLVTVPVWDYAIGNGQGVDYHIVGFAGFEITNCKGGKDIEGIWRSGIFTSPNGQPPLPAGVSPVSIQLIKIGRTSWPTLDRHRRARQAIAA